MGQSPGPFKKALVGGNCIPLLQKCSIAGKNVAGFVFPSFFFKCKLKI